MLACLNLARDELLVLRFFSVPEYLNLSAHFLFVTADFIFLVRQLGMIPNKYVLAVNSGQIVSASIVRDYLSFSPNRVPSAVYVSLVWCSLTTISCSEPSDFGATL